MLEPPENRRKLALLIRTSSRAQGFHVQYNVVSRETLLAAQKNPRNTGLVVRVAGYSAFFTILSRVTQTTSLPHGTAALTDRRGLRRRALAGRKKGGSRGGESGVVFLAKRRS